MAINNAISPAFVKHLSFFTSSKYPDKITLFSALKASLSLGLNFPVSVLFSLALRVLYSPTIVAAPSLEQLRPSQQRTMLESVVLDTKVSSWSRREFMALIPPPENTWVNRGHILGLWALAANKDGKVNREDILRIQDGVLMQSIRRRRLDRSDVLPFRRGGPGNVAGHSWVVSKLFGVRVYLDDGKMK